MFFIIVVQIIVGIIYKKKNIYIYIYIYKDQIETKVFFVNVKKIVYRSLHIVNM